MLCVTSPPISAYSFSAFNGNAPRFSPPLPKTAMPESTIVSFVCFIQPAGYGVADLFMPVPLQAITEGSRLRANDQVPLSPWSQMRANVLARGLSRLISDCAVDPVAAILAFAHLDEIDWTAPDCVD